MTDADAAELHRKLADWHAEKRKSAILDIVAEAHEATESDLRSWVVGLERKASRPECERDGWSENPEAHAAFKRHFG